MHKWVNIVLTSAKFFWRILCELIHLIFITPLSFKEVAWLAQQGKGKTRILTQVILLPHTFLTTVQQTLIQSLLIPFSLLKYKGRLLFPSSPAVSLGLHDLLLSKETQMYRTDFWTLWEKARVGWSERIALKHVYYQVWNGSPAQVGCMRQVLRAGALRRPRGMGWGGRWEGGFRMENTCKSMAD